MTSVRRALVVAGLGLAALLASPGPAHAHPLGNFTVNTHATIVVEPGQVTVRYVVDMAEIPTFRELPRVDADGDGATDAGERAAYARERAASIVRRLALTLDGRAVALGIRSATVRVLPGQGGLSILRLEAEVAGTGRFTAGRVEFRDANFAGRLGWREVVALGANGVVLRSPSVRAKSLSDELRRYPQDLLSDPPSVTSAAFSLARGASGSAPAAQADGPAGQRPGTETGGFAALATWALSLPVVLLALGLAMAFGAGHALMPGHGKTIMAAYLVGSGGRALHAAQVGIAVAIMHTASVLALGLVVLLLASVAPERVYPWLTLASGLVVLALGAGMLRRRIRTRAAVDDHDHGPEHHDHGPEHDHDHAPDHSHEPLGDRPLSRRSLSALALSGGILPSPTALVVLLSTVHANRAGFGLALILAFSVGMAATLTGIGLLALGSRELVRRRLRGRMGRLLPVASATAIVGVGTFLVARAALQL